MKPDVKFLDTVNPFNPQSFKGTFSGNQGTYTFKSNIGSGTFDIFVGRLGFENEYGKLVGVALLEPDTRRTYFKNFSSDIYTWYEPKN